MNYFSPTLFPQDLEFARTTYIRTGIAQRIGIMIWGDLSTIVAPFKSFDPGVETVIFPIPKDLSDFFFPL